MTAPHPRLESRRALHFDPPANMLRPTPALAILLISTALISRAQPIQGGGLFGRVSNGAYISPTGAFQVPIPVRPETGGTITDTANVVTFQDDYDILDIIAAFPMDPSQKWELSIKTKAEYLQGFFSQYVLPDFRRAFPKVEVESTGTFIPSLCDGALVVYTLLPGGSLFASKVPTIDPNRKPPVAKRGNMLFVRNGFIFVVSNELAERATEGSAFTLTQTEEDVLLRERLTDLVAKIHFQSPPAAR